MAHDVRYDRRSCYPSICLVGTGKYHGNRCWGNYLRHLVPGTEKSRGIVSGELITRPRLETNKQLPNTKLTAFLPEPACSVRILRISNVRNKKLNYYSGVYLRQNVDEEHTVLYKIIIEIGNALRPSSFKCRSYQKSCKNLPFEVTETIIACDVSLAIT